MPNFFQSYVPKASSVRDFAVISAMCAILGLTVVKQLRDQSWAAKLLKVRPIDGLVPDWRFFAPNPGRHDAHLLYRFCLDDEQVSAWREVALLETRKFSHCIWMPTCRQEKVVADAASGIMELSQSDAIQNDSKSLLDAAEISVPYNLLLNCVLDVPRPEGAKGVQFLLINSAGNDLSEQPKGSFISFFHRTEGTNERV